ncbi:MAG: hypothetical protein EOO77_32575 [Oxalobacteraceae bacterium]|nr:MAG: hypothetical protein EOO77_32575 [Oxalobacteraceae bacterium]
MNPIAWVKPFEHDYYEGNDPGVGQFTLSAHRGGDSQEPLKISFAPQIPAGDDFMSVMERVKQMEKPDGSHYRDYEYQKFAAMIRMGREHHGYVYEFEEGKRLFEIARSRPETGDINQMILDAGFEFHHYMAQAVVKTYRKKIRYGGFTLFRGVDHIHLTFERATAQSWTNVFRYHRFLVAQNGEHWPLIWPDYLDSMEIATLLALDTARQFEADGLNRRRAYKPI